MTKETVKQNQTETAAKKNAADQAALFVGSDINTLMELVEAFGIPADRIPEDPTKEDLVNLLLAVKRHDIAVAKTVAMQDGTEKECPPGHMIIRVTPKAAGMEWGQKSREVFFFAVQCECVVGKRGATVVIPDKYRSAWRDAVGYDYTMNGDPQVNPTTGELIPPKMTKVEKFAEDVAELYWNRDTEKEKATELDLIEGSKRYMAEKAQEKALARAVQQVVR